MTPKEIAEQWFKTMEDKGYTKETVFIAGYKKGINDLKKRIKSLPTVLKGSVEKNK